MDIRSDCSWKEKLIFSKGKLISMDLSLEELTRILVLACPDRTPALSLFISHWSSHKTDETFHRLRFIERENSDQLEKERR